MVKLSHLSDVTQNWVLYLTTLTMAPGNFPTLVPEKVSLYCLEDEFERSTYHQTFVRAMAETQESAVSQPH